MRNYGADLCRPFDDFYVFDPYVFPDSHVLRIERMISEAERRWEQEKMLIAEDYQLRVREQHEYLAREMMLLQMDVAMKYRDGAEELRRHIAEETTP